MSSELFENKKIAVLLPCYNESVTIKKVVEDFKTALPEATVYVYDNNSSDHTDEIARNAGACVVYEYRQGKGNVIRSMFRDIDADCYVMADGDDTYPADNARELCEAVLSGKADMAIGDRLSSTYFTENKRPFHNFGNRLVRLLVNKLFKCNVSDIMTGYRAFSYDFVKGFPVLSGGFEIETEMTIHAVDKNYKLVEIPVGYRDRPEGSFSKLNTVSDGIKVLKTVATLFRRYKPNTYYTIISGIFVLAGVGCYIAPVIEYFKNGTVEHKALFALGCLFILSATAFKICGSILRVITHNTKQQYELTMNLLKKDKDNK